MPLILHGLELGALLASKARQATRYKRLAPLTDNLALPESGLDSLCFPVVVARLEDVLGINPFSAVEDVRFPVTVGEFIRFYENAAK